MRLLSYLRLGGLLALPRMVPVALYAKATSAVALLTMTAVLSGCASLTPTYNF